MKTVFFDIDTQIDFLFPAGALYVPGAEKIVPAIGQLNRHAGSRGMPVVSTMCAHAEDDPEFLEWPPHCVAGTAGQQKPAATLLEKRVVVPNSSADLAVVDGAQQILLEKQMLDLFTNVNTNALIERLQADRYVVYGVVTEYCVRCAAMGLLKTGKPVYIVTDAIETLKREDSETTLREARSAGGVLATVAEVLSL